MPAPPLDIRIMPGTTPYRDAAALQSALVTARQAGEIPDTLLLLSHPPTVTYGRMAQRTNLRLTPAEYTRAGIELIASDRGGDATYHAPGQLVGYPILHMGDGNRDIHRYVRTLETVLLESCWEMGVERASTVDFHAGIWVGYAYLAAVGVRVQRWVTSHGFALNVEESIRDGFDTIIPCGVVGKSITTIAAESGRDVTVSDAAVVVSRHFRAWHEQRTDADHLLTP